MTGASGARGATDPNKTGAGPAVGPATPLDVAIDAAGREAAALAPRLVELRRDLHRHPEPSWEEHRTTEALTAVLRNAGLDPRPTATATGLVCDIGTGDGPLIALRADIDALRMPDAKDVEYRSTVPGVCHACGHDVHAAVVVGAGLALARLGVGVGEGVAGIGAGRVRLVLQPAEEAVPSGAPALCDAGVMDGVRAIFAVHCDPSRDAGAIGLAAGPICSAADQVVIRLKGPGGHTARPHLTADLVHLIAKVVVEVPAGLVKLSDSRDGVNLTFGHVEAGDAPNVIPSEAMLRGSLRASGRQSWQDAGPKLRRLLAAVVEPFGAKWELEHNVGGPPVVNDAWAVGLVDQAARRVLGDAAVGTTVQSAGGEDFGWYLDHAPGAYIRLGVRPPGADVIDIHSSAFDVDESAIGAGAALLAATVLVAHDDLGA